jgi:hypothetical protein
MARVFETMNITGERTTRDHKDKASIRELIVRVLADITILLRAEFESIRDEIIEVIRTNVTRTVSQIIQKEIMPPLKATALPSALIGLAVALICTAGLLFTFAGVYGWVEAGMPTWLAFLVQGLILLLVAAIMIAIAAALLNRYVKRTQANKLKVQKTKDLTTSR